MGSPPLMREPRHHTAYCTVNFRITPAHAGTTSSVWYDVVYFRDHPRSCGNHFWCGVVNSRFAGSPPLMREPLMRHFYEIIGYRITPAHAGTTNKP